MSTFCNSSFTYSPIVAQILCTTKILNQDNKVDRQVELNPTYPVSLFGMISIP